jgi:NADH-ubiquinone oxidoreductase chain 5
MYLTLITLPLLASLFSGFLGRKLGKLGVYIINCSSIIITVLLILIVFYEVGLNQSPVSIKLFTWIDSELLNISWSLLFDSLTISILLPVTIVSTLVHIYSIGYIYEDPHNQRFFSYLSIFTFFILVLVTSDNYLLLFVGWEGVRNHILFTY